MPVLANKEGIKLVDQVYHRREIVPSEIIEAIPEHRRGALFRTRLLVEVTDAELADNPAFTPEPDPTVCPHCGEGPFVRLQRHITSKHPEQTIDTSLVELTDTAVEPVELTGEADGTASVEEHPEEDS